VKKNHDNTDIDYFYNSGIDYLSKSFLEIEKEFKTFLFSLIERRRKMEKKSILWIISFFVGKLKKSLKKILVIL
jgi:hypothetical protein